MISKPSNVECGTHDDACSIKCFSWSAVVAGALVGIGLSFLLNLFGVAIGLTAYPTSAEGVTTLAIGGFVGMAIGVIGSMFVSGWVSGYLGRKTCLYPHLGVLYGFASWCLSLLVMIALAGSASDFMTLQYDKATNPNILLQKMTAATTAVKVNDANAPTKNTTVTTVNDEQAAKMAGKSLFLIFTLFFIGAITSAFGGYIGMKREKDEKPSAHYTSNNT